MKEKKWTYRQAGVDVEAGEEAVQAIKKMVLDTFSGHDVFEAEGGFSGVYKISEDNFLLATCDGVGSKLLIAREMNDLSTIGQDLVAMSINDLLAQGGRPLFFLDYIALNRVEKDMVEDLVSGMARACKKARCALLGGETAEMPDLYSPGNFDLAGFAVGVARENELLPSPEIQKGDLLLSLPSSGLHSNGYTLVRRVLLETAGYKLEDTPEGWDTTLGEELLRPTEIYTEILFALRQNFNIKGLANITGGGLLGNIPRMLGDRFTYELNRKALNPQPVFDLLAREGNIEKEEMLSTFNMGSGMVAAVPAAEALDAVEYLNNEFFTGKQHQASLIGEIKEAR